MRLPSWASKTLKNMWGTTAGSIQRDKGTRRRRQREVMTYAWSGLVSGGLREANRDRRRNPSPSLISTPAFTRVGARRASLGGLIKKGSAER